MQFVWNQNLGDLPYGTSSKYLNNAVVKICKGSYRTKGQWGCPQNHSTLINGYWNRKVFLLSMP
jgi:hypothetical protein